MAIWLDAKLVWSQELFFPAIIDFFHGYGLAVRKILFWSLFLLFWGTGLHKFFGNVLLQLIGWVVALVIVVIVVIAGYYFLRWISGTI